MRLIIACSAIDRSTGGCHRGGRMRNPPWGTEKSWWSPMLSPHGKILDRCSSAFQAETYEFASSSLEADGAALVIDIPVSILTIEIVPVQFEGLKRVELTLGY